MNDMLLHIQLPNSFFANESLERLPYVVFCVNCLLVLALLCPLSAALHCHLPAGQALLTQSKHYISFT